MSIACPDQRRLPGGLTNLAILSPQTRRARVHEDFSAGRVAEGLLAPPGPRPRAPAAVRRARRPRSSGPSFPCQRTHVAVDVAEECRIFDQRVLACAANLAQKCSNTVLHFATAAGATAAAGSARARLRCGGTNLQVPPQLVGTAAPGRGHRSVEAVTQQPARMKTVVCPRASKRAQR